MDFGKMLMGGFANIGSGLGWLARKTGADPRGLIETSFNDAVDWWNNSLSDAAKHEVAKKLVTRDEDGDLTWGDAGLTSVALQATGIAPDVAASLLGGGGTVKALRMFANPMGRKALQETIEAGAKAGASIEAQRAALQAQKKLAMVDSALGIGGFGGFEGVYAGAQNAGEVEQMIMARPHEDLMASERYRQIFDATDDSSPIEERIQYAKETLRQEAGTEAFWKSGIATATLGAPAGAFFGKMLGAASLAKHGSSKIPAFGAINERMAGGAATRGGAVARGGLMEGVTEGVQEATETAIALDVFNRAAAGDEDLLAESINAGILGSIVGAGAGGGFGAVGYTKPGVRDSDPDLNNVDFRSLRLDTTEKLQQRIQNSDIDQMTDLAQKFEQIQALEAEGTSRLETLAMYDVLAETGEMPRASRGIDAELNDANPDQFAAAMQKIAKVMTPEQLNHVRTIDPITTVRNLDALRGMPPEAEYVALRSNAQDVVGNEAGPEAGRWLAGHIGRKLSERNIDVYHAGDGTFIVPAKSKREQRRLRDAVEEIEPLTLTKGDREIEVQPGIVMERAAADQSIDPWQPAVEAARANVGKPTIRIRPSSPASSDQSAQTQQPTPAVVDAQASPEEATDLIEQAAAQSATSPQNNLEPSQQDLEAGNYQKGRVRFQHGIDVSIENPIGSTRKGRNSQTGRAWSRTMQNHYGSIEGTQGNDGDPVDVFLGSAPNNPLRPVVVVDQYKPDGTFDEHKVMLGFRTPEAALEAYRQNYPDENVAEGSATTLGFQEFKAWLDGADKSQPVGPPPTHAETVRSDQGRPDQTGRARAFGEGMGGRDLQQPEVTGPAGGRQAPNQEEQAPSLTEDIDAVPKTEPGRFRFSVGTVKDSEVRFKSITPVTSTVNPELSFRTNRQGEILVSGPIPAIRAVLQSRGIDVKGRVNAAGNLLFTPNATPSVRSALMGETTLQGRAGIVTEHRLDKDGNWVGAPPDYPTEKTFKKRRAIARQLLDEGFEGREWYEKSAQGALKMFGGDEQKARKYLGLLAIYSPNTEVQANTTAALKAWFQWRAGIDPNAGLGDSDKKAKAWLNADTFGASQKVTNFYQNLVAHLEGNRPDLTQGATIDLWMMRAFGFKTDKPTKNQYGFAEVEVNRLAEEANIPPHQVQAAMWVAIKARMNNIGVKRETEAQSIRAGDMKKVRDKDGKLVREFVGGEDSPAAERHRRRWFRNAMAHELTDADMERALLDYDEALISNYLTQVSWEAAPGADTGLLPGYATATPEQKAEFVEAIEAVLVDPKGGNRLANEMGIPWLGRFNGPGVWKGKSETSTQDVIPIPYATGSQSGQERSLDPSAVKALDAYAAILGRALNQEGMGWTHPDYASTKGRANGVHVKIGREMTAGEALALESAVNAQVPEGTDVVFVASKSGMSVFQLPRFGETGPEVGENGDLVYNMDNYQRAKAKPDFHKAVKAAAANAIDSDVDIEYFRTESNLIENNWLEATDGQDYLRTATESGYGRAADWADRVLAPEIRAVYDRFSERYGWGAVDRQVEQGEYRFSVTPTGDAGGGARAPPDELARGGVPRGDRPAPQKPGQETLVGINFTATQRSLLDGRYYGTGMRGAEWARVSSASDTRIKHRVYMYVDNGSGIRPESGVGQYAKRVTMENLYDSSADPLGLEAKHGSDANAIESAILDHGYDGYFVRRSLDGQATAVMLGDASHAVKAEPLDQVEPTPQVAQEPPTTPGRELLTRIRALDGKVKSGSLSPDTWRGEIGPLNPELLQEMEDSGIFDSMDPDGNYYLSDLAKRAMRAEQEANRAKVEALLQEIEDTVDEPAIGADLRRRWTEDFDAVQREYEQNPESEGGVVLNTDVARELSPEYRDDRTRSADVHEAASDFVKAMYARRLARPTQEGYESRVLFSAGGTGAGKTSGLKQVDVGNPEIIYDTNGNNVPSTRNKIDAALEAGRDVEIVYTHRDPIESFENGVIPRTMRMMRDQGSGRTVPTYIHAETHAQANAAIRELAEIYADDPRVTIRVVDNSRGKDNATEIPLESLPTVPSQEEINEQILEIVEAAAASGTIPREVAEGYRVRETEPGREGGQDRQSDRGQPERERQERDADRLRKSVAAIPGLRDAKEYAKADRMAADAAASEATLLSAGWSHAKTKDGEIVMLPIRELQKRGYGSTRAQILNWLAGSMFEGMDIKVHDDHRGAPPELQRAMGFDPTGQNNQQLPVEAAYDTKTGEVHVFANMVVSKELHRILTEEIVGHAGLRALLGERLDQFLDTSEISRARLLPVARTYGLDLNNETDLRIAREEYLAKLTPESDPGLWNRFMDWLRQALRDLGLKLELTDAEGQRLLHRAREAVLRGTAPTASFAAEVRQSRAEAVNLDESWRFSVAAVADGGSRVTEILNRVLAKSDYAMSPGEKLFDLKSKAGDFFDDWQLKAKQGMIDSGASLEQLERELHGGLAEGAESAWKAYHLTHNLENVMSAVIKYGVPMRDEQGWFTIDPNGKGLSEIFSPLVKDGSNLMRLWEGYAAARRAQQLAIESNADGSPKEKLMAPDEIETLLDLGREYPVLERVFDEYQAFNRKMLDLAVDVGLLDGDARDMWEQYDYVPFYRVFEDVEGPSGIGSGSSAEVRGTGIKRLRGSERKLQPILENITMNTANLVDKIYKHEAMKKIRDLGLEAGAIEELPQSWKPVRMSNGQIADTLRKAGMLTGRAGEIMEETGEGAPEAYRALVEDMTGQERDQFQTMFQMSIPQGKDVVGVVENGRTKYYRVTDPLLLRTIKGMGSENFGHFVRLMRGFRSTLTNMVTLDPGFMMANWMRDTLSAWVTSSDVDFTPLTDAVRAFGDIWTGDRDSVYAQVLMAGGSGGGFYDVHPGDVTETMVRQTGATVLNTPSRILAAYRRIGNVSEQSNRIAIGSAVLKNGGSIAEAAFQAQDVTNFTSHGDWAAMRLLTQTVPFMNARIQGLYKLYRGGRDNPTKFMLRGTGVIAATALLLAKNWDDERYEELPDWQKDIYWHVFVGDQHFAIPKPFEVGVIFGALPERMLRLAGGTDELQDTGRFLATTVGETFAMNPIPQMFKPLIEQWANKSFFMGRDIVPFYQTGLQPEAQYRHYTSDTARLVADLMPDFMPEMLRSPARIEHLVRGYLGTLGAYMMDASDVVSNKVAGYAPAPETSILDFPAIKRFVRGSGPQATRYESMLWDSLKEADAAFSTMNAYVRQGRPEEAEELRADKGDLLRNRKALQGVANTIRELNNAEKQIQFSLMPPAEKRERLDEIQRRKNEILRRTVPSLYLQIR